MNIRTAIKQLLDLEVSVNQQLCIMVDGQPTIVDRIVYDDNNNVVLIPVVEPAWVSLEDFSGNFSEIRLEINTHIALNADEVQIIGDTLGYALMQYIGVEDGLPLPHIIQNDDNGCILEYSYDSSDGRRSDVDYIQLIDEFNEYLVSGSPVRSTNRSGANKKGTRLVEGLGVELEIIIKVR
jgi:hypothetical protein